MIFIKNIMRMLPKTRKSPALKSVCQGWQKEEHGSGPSAITHVHPSKTAEP